MGLASAIFQSQSQQNQALRARSALAEHEVDTQAR